MSAEVRTSSAPAARTGRLRSVFGGYALAATLAGAAAAASPGFLKAQGLRQEAAAAEARGDYAAAEAALEKALELRASHPGIILALAGVEARQGKAGEALTHLQQFVTMGLAANLGETDAFASLRYNPQFIGVLAGIARNTNPVGHPEIAAHLGDGRALFEGLAIDPESGRIFASSVRQRRIVVVEGGAARDFVPPGAEGLWSVFGLAIDAPRGLLWAASAAGPQSEGVAPAEYGAAGVFAFDLQTGALKRKAVLGPDAKAAFGDLAVAPDGTVYVSDSNGALYRLPPASQTLEPFAPDVRYVSPQGLAVVADGRVLMVADYAMGLFSIDTGTQTVTRLTAASGVTLLGLDGLAGTGPLIATQNGVAPQRVLRLEIGSEWDDVLSVEVLSANAPFHHEITLGAIWDGGFWYVANSQWDRFGPDGQVLGESPFAETVVARIALPPPDAPAE